MPEGSAFLLDTSALIALRRDEAGADHVQKLIEDAQKGRCRLFVSFMTRMELLYIIRRNEGEEAATGALRLLDLLPLDWVSCDTTILETAARLKAEGSLSVADSWIGATAVEQEASLVHRDPEFIPVKEIPQKVLGQ